MSCWPSMAGGEIKDAKGDRGFGRNHRSGEVGKGDRLQAIAAYRYRRKNWPSPADDPAAHRRRRRWRSRRRRLRPRRPPPLKPLRLLIRIRVDRRLAHKKAGGSSRNGRDSRPGRRLGVKKFGRSEVVGDGIIIRQRGTRVYRGQQCRHRARDHTLFALIRSAIRFNGKLGRKFCRSGCSCRRITGWSITGILDADKPRQNTTVGRTKG